jgi:hypothetical protein
LATEQDLHGFVGQRLAAFKTPRKIVLLAEIPKGATGKLQRIGLAQKLGLEWANSCPELGRAAEFEVDVETNSCCCCPNTSSFLRASREAEERHRSSGIILCRWGGDPCAVELAFSFFARPFWA